ncbi:hypothetical protein Tco_1263121 [Tanacetum coccineum]
MCSICSYVLSILAACIYNEITIITFMAASAIIISSDSSDESVGSPPSRVILFGDIPTVIPSTSVVAPETSTIAPVISSAAPMVETTLVASPTGLCGLVPYTGSDSDSPDEMTLPEHISPLPAISPFICTDSSEAPDSSDGPPSQDPYVATVARWRSRVTTRPSSSHEFPIAPIYSRRPGIVDGQRLLSDPRRLFLLVDLTAPILTGRFIFGILAIHSFGFGWRQIRLHGSSTIDVPPRLCYPPRRAPRRSEAFRHWCAAPLSTLYPPTTSESSSGDSSERPMHYLHIPTGPSGKRLIPGLDLAPLSMPDTRSITPTRTYLSPPRKGGGWRSVGKETIGGGVGGGGVGCQDDTEEYAAARHAGDTAEVGIDPMTAPLVKEEIVEPAREVSPDSSGTRDGIVRSVEDMPVDLGDDVHDFYHHMSEVRVNRIVGIETAQRRLEADQLIASGDRARMAEMIYSLRLENLKVPAMLDIERDHVRNLRLYMSLSQEEFCQIRRDRDDARGRLRRLESYLGRRFGFRP